MPEEEFRRRLLTAVQARPGVLAEMLEGLDERPFHDLLARPGMKGKPVLAFGAVLRVADGLGVGGGRVDHAGRGRADRGQFAESAAAAGGRGTAWLYDSYRFCFGRCLQRPAKWPGRAWVGLGFGMVIVHLLVADLQAEAERQRWNFDAGCSAEAWTSARST